MKPLTHHEILELIGPFTRRGRRVDLSASNRLERRLVFKPIEHAGGPPAAPVVRETLVLEHFGEADHRLTRTSTLANGLEARLEAEGSDLGGLLDLMDTIAPQSQFHEGEGFAMAASQRLQAGGAGATDGEALLIFQSGQARLAGLTLTVDATTVQRGRAPVRIFAAPGVAMSLPEDALAVLGRDWSRIKSTAEGWAGHFQVRAREPRRSRHAEAALEAAARHLARMLGEAPSRFHARWLVSRWRVFFRRLTPVAVLLGLVLGAAAVPRLHLAESSGLRMLILNCPPILMMLFFCMREVPIIEIPPLPRRPAAASWRLGEPARAHR